MLLNLHIKNFGLIDQLSMELQDGLNVLTGETGAGKSIILGALRIVLGGRAAPGEQIRTGADKMWLQATFDICCHNTLLDLLKEQGIDAPEDDILILTREVARSGKNICRLSGQTTPLSFYRVVGSNLVDTHVQHEQHSLLDQTRHRALLDRFGGATLLNKLQVVGEIYSRWQETDKKLKKITDSAADKNKQVDLLLYAINEIEQIAPRTGEDKELEAEKQVLANMERICQLAGDAYSLLYEGSRGQQPVTDLLSLTLELLRVLAQFDVSKKHMHQSLENIFYQIEEIARQLAGLREGVERDPHRLEAVEERLALLNNLKKKYAPTLSGVLDYLEQARLELELLDNNQELQKKIQGELQSLEQYYRQAAASLSDLRANAARLLEEEVARVLIDLDMGRVQCQVALTQVEELTPTGSEQVEFLISPNPGEPLKPLVKTASGGELSRIMLALKALLAEVDEVPVLVFDEVDTGIGGRALTAVAEKLAKISVHRQIICVTHAPQVASYATAHHLVRKEFDGERVYTRVDHLTEAERVEELARMLDGKDVTGISRQHAGHMLMSAGKKTKETDNCSQQTNK